MTAASTRLIPQTIDGCWILSKLWRRRVKMCQESDGNSAMSTVKVWALLSLFSSARSNSAPHGPHNYLGYGKWLNQKYGLRKATRSEVWATESDSIRSMGYGKRLNQKYGLRKATQSEVWATESDSIRSMGYGKRLDQKYGLWKATRSEVWATESDSIRSMGYGKRLNQKYGLQKASRSEVFGQKSVRNTRLTKYSDLCSVCTKSVHFIPEQSEGPVACESQLCAMTQASPPIQLVCWRARQFVSINNQLLEAMLTMCVAWRASCATNKKSWFESSLRVTVHPHPQFNCFSDQITGWHLLYFGSRIQTARYKQQMDRQ